MMRQRCENGECESDRHDVSEKRNIPWPSPSRKESIMNCLLIGNRGFVDKIVSRNLSNLIEEGKWKKAGK